MKYNTIFTRYYREYESALFTVSYELNKKRNRILSFASDTHTHTDMADEPTHVYPEAIVGNSHDNELNKLQDAPSDIIN